ncbi:MAG: ubiquinol-cytochrome c reductase iron-sulfur subunit [Alphaproteobacteria bacterium]|nr:ubiquinol-cytochrome c reductase iron-sulfur subunit [Alphaproteobacteria bacterium]
MSAGANIQNGQHDDGETRRGFMQMLAGAFGAVGLGAFLVPAVNSLNPAKDTLALSTVEVDLSDVPVGGSKTVMWQGKPIFIRHRTAEEITEAEDVDVQTLTDKQTDESRVEKPEWLVVVGVCTHLGCIPQGQKTTDNHGEFGGWFCSCHGSQYDTSGRIRKGPAPKNLAVPPYKFVNDTTIKIG